MNSKPRPAHLTGYDDGWSEGYAEGWAQGYAEGLADGARALCALRFGRVSADIHQRIEALSITGLRALYRQIKASPTADALLALAEAATHDA